MIEDFPHINFYRLLQKLIVALCMYRSAMFFLIIAASHSVPIHIQSADKWNRKEHLVVKFLAA